METKNTGKVEKSKKNLNKIFNEFKNIQSFRSETYGISNAFFTIERKLQEEEEAEEEYRVCVKLRIYLHTIKDEFVNGLEKVLDIYWRYDCKERCRYADKYIYADTLFNAFIGAFKIAEDEINFIEGIINNTYKVLQIAEESNKKR